MSSKGWQIVERKSVDRVSTTSEEKLILNKTGPNDEQSQNCTLFVENFPSNDSLRNLAFFINLQLNSQNQIYRYALSIAVIIKKANGSGI